jgi:transposase
VPALPSSILEPLWVQVAALLPTRQVHHPLGCHRPRIPDRVVFDKLIQIPVFGCGYRRIADATCSATTLRRRRDEWISAGVAGQLGLAVLAAYDRLFGLNLDQLPLGRPPPPPTVTTYQCRPLAFNPVPRCSSDPYPHRVRGLAFSRTARCSRPRSCHQPAWGAPVAGHRAGGGRHL